MSPSRLAPCLARARRVTGENRCWLPAQRDLRAGRPAGPSPGAVVLALGLASQPPGGLVEAHVATRASDSRGLEPGQRISISSPGDAGLPVPRPHSKRTTVLESSPQPHLLNVQPANPYPFSRGLWVRRRVWALVEENTNSRSHCQDSWCSRRGRCTKR